MNWIPQQQGSTGHSNADAAWLVDAADQAAGWLVEPAIAAGRLELLTASLQLSQAAELLVERTASGRPHVASPGERDHIDKLCRELVDVVAAARDALARQGKTGDDDAAEVGEGALLLEQAQRTISGSQS